MKRERSPTPTLEHTARPVTSGTHLVLPYPPECQKTDPKYAEARRQLAATTKKMLITKGLRPTKSVIRDDGLAIDWISAVAVWSDTYAPVESTSTVATPVTELQPIQHGNASNENTMTSPLPQTTDIEHPVQMRSQHIHDLVSNFLLRYSQTFDTDRGKVVNAYHPYARFSYSTHELFQRNTLAGEFINVKKVERFAPRKNSRNLVHHQYGRAFIGRREIAEAMTALGPHKYCETSPVDIHWHACHLDPDFIQILCHGTLVDAGQRIAFDHSFLLVKADENRDTPDPWALLIVSHLLTVRDPSLMLKAI